MAASALTEDDKGSKVKCPETKFLVLPLDACSDSNFFLENQNGELKLKQNHKYYT